MTSTSSRPALLVVGAGPGLGIDGARRRGNRGGDIHRAVLDHPDLLADMAAATLNPDDLANTLWRMYTSRTDSEVVVNALVQ